MIRKTAMSMPAFYLAQSQWGSCVHLRPPESHHLQVLRLACDDEVELLDGVGHIGVFVITDIRKNEVILQKKTETFHPRPTSLPILALGLSKTIRRSFLLEKAAELGASGIWLFQGQFSQAKLVPSLAEKIEPTLIAGCKQSKNPWLPEIRLFPQGLSELTEALSGIDHRYLPWEGETSKAMISLSDLGLPGKTIYAIGPEGGFAPRELEVLDQAQFQRVSLGARVLRCETAATLCLGLHWWASQLSQAKDSAL